MMRDWRLSDTIPAPTVNTEKLVSFVKSCNSLNDGNACQA